MSTPRRPQPGHVVLCVDDEPAILTSIRRLLRAEPYELMTTLCPSEALDWVGQMEVSLIIADQRMPDLTGTELLRTIRERSPGTVRVMLTAFPDRTTIQQRVSQDIQRLITKPWQGDALKDIIREMLRVREEDDRIFGRLAFIPELVVPVECQGRTTEEVIGAIASRVEGNEFDGLVLLMRDLKSLDGSVPTFLRELVDEMGRLEMPVSIVDKTGCASEFLEALNGSAPVTVYGATAVRERWILYVDPDEDERSRLRQVLEAAGHVCVAVPGAAEAKRCLKQSKFDAVFVDPVVEGFQEIRAEAGEVPLLLVSDRTELWDDAACAKLGVRGCLSKPCRTDEIFERIEEL